MAEKEEAPERDFDAKTLKRAEFCRDKCFACRVGREKGRGILYHIVRLESRLKFCPWCRAYEKVYGVPAYEKPPR